MDEKRFPVTVVAATKYTSGGGIELPWRYVVLKWDKGSSAHEYSRHMQVFDANNDQAFYYGHYYMTFEDALYDLTKTMNDNNKSFPKGNVSYIPGMDFINGDEVEVEKRG
jgi:hypothetical protein